MNIDDFKGKKITVMGLGLHGGAVGVIKFLAEAGAKIIVTDLKSENELMPSVEKLRGMKGIEYVLGQHRDVDFSQADMIIKNPGVSWKSKYIQLALENNIPVEMDSSLFFKLCKNRIIGVTGTRGKTTTTSLIYEILRKAGKNVVQVGIGQIAVLDKLQELEEDSIVVFELSSWRLSALGRYGLSPHIAVITNIFQDHLNYYANMDEYIQDKKYIFSSQKKSDFCIINWDDDRLRSMQGEINSQMIKFSRNKIDQNTSVYVFDNAIYSRKEGREEKIMAVEEIKIRGSHNISNILASIGVAQALNMDIDEIRNGTLSFKGLPHRLEFVRELDGVGYYNDTAATSPDGAISGINSFVEPIVLIAGGSDKNLDMCELARAIKEKAKKIILLKGEGTNKIIGEWQGSSIEYGTVDSMDEAVNLARKLAQNGDVVLLSPGAASFGLFVNEFDRGDKFRLAVNNLR